MASTDRNRVSILMSVFDGAQFLDHAIHSIRQQTFGSFEFIIVDDGSTDGTAEILSRHAREDSRLRVISQKNRGLIEALHRAFADASGEYVARMDADDVAKPERLQKQVDFLDANANVAVVGSAVEIIDTDSRVVNTIRFPSDPATVRNHMRERGCVVFHPSVMIRREAFRSAGGFRRAYRHAEDYDLWLRMLENFDVANLDDVLLSYRRHEKTVSYKNVQQQALSAFCARVMAQVRLKGDPDPTSELDLVTESVLERLGLGRKEIDHAVFTHMIAVTEDVIRSGLRSAAAEFARGARRYASAVQVRTAVAKLNRIALSVPCNTAEERKHRVRLLATAPDVYWELFGPFFSARTALHKNSEWRDESSGGENSPP